MSMRLLYECLKTESYYPYGAYSGAGSLAGGMRNDPCTDNLTQMGAFHVGLGKNLVIGLPNRMDAGIIERGAE